MKWKALLALSHRRHLQQENTTCRLTDFFNGNCTLETFCDSVATNYFQATNTSVTTCVGSLQGPWAFDIYSKEACYSSLEDAFALEPSMAGTEYSANTPYCSRFRISMQFNQRNATLFTDSTELTRPYEVAIQEDYGYRDCGTDLPQDIWDDFGYCYSSFCPRVRVNGMLCNNECVFPCTNETETPIPDCTNVDDRLTWGCGYANYQGPDYYQPLVDFVTPRPPTSAPTGRPRDPTGTPSVVPTSEPTKDTNMPTVARMGQEGEDTDAPIASSDSTQPPPATSSGWRIAADSLWLLCSLL